MKKILLIPNIVTLGLLILFGVHYNIPQKVFKKVNNQSDINLETVPIELVNNLPDTSYLSNIKSELKKEWPNNRTINLVFHGHSVPAGYFKTPVVKTLESYPFQVLRKLKAIYPFAVINIINTAIGGENSFNGEKRFKYEVLNHKPDVVFIDYALNDVGIGLGKSVNAWRSMIEMALANNVKVVLLTPSPDQRINILDDSNVLEQHSKQIKGLAMTYKIGLADSYAIFKELALSGDTLSNYLSQVNHPNEKGNSFIANEILKYFE